MQPLSGEVGHQVGRARVGQHPPHLRVEDVRRAQFAAFGQPQQFIVRNAAPQEERQARRQLQVTEPVGGARLHALRILLDPEQEFRTHQHRGQPQFDAGVEAPLLARRAVQPERPFQVGVGDRTAIGPPHHVGEDLTRAGGFLLHGRRLTTEDTGAARGVTGAGRVVRPDDRDLVNRRLNSRMPVVVEMRLIWLPLGFEQQLRLLRKRDGERMRPRGDRHPPRQVRVQVVLRGLIVQVMLRDLDRRDHGEGLDQLAVKQEFDVVRLAQPLDVLVPVTRQTDRNLVVAVDRKRVREQDAAARPDRHARQMPLLREVGSRTHGRTVRPETRPPHRQPADLLGRRDVALEQRRRQIADRDVVEPEAGRIAGKQHRHVDLQVQQVTDGVVILGAVESPEGVGAARVRPRGRLAIERPFEGGDRGLVVRLVRPTRARRGHLPRTQLPHDPLPDFGVVAERRRVDRLEAETAGPGPVVVAGQAILVYNSGVRARCRRDRVTLPRLGAERARKTGEHDTARDRPAQCLWAQHWFPPRSASRTGGCSQILLYTCRRSGRRYFRSIRDISVRDHSGAGARSSPRAISRVFVMPTLPS